MSLRKQSTHPYLNSVFAFCLSSLCLMTTVPRAYAEMSKSEAATKAKNNHSGKVLSVDLISSKNGLDTYRVKLLMPDGRVKTVTVSG